MDKGKCSAKWILPSKLRYKKLAKTFRCFEQESRGAAHIYTLCGKALCWIGRGEGLFLHLCIIDHKNEFFFLAFIRKPEYVEMASQIIGTAATQAPPAPARCCKRS